MAKSQSRGRKPINVEFLNKLMEVEQIEKPSEFAERCGQAASNMGDYLNNRRKPGVRVLRKCLRQFYGQLNEQSNSIKPIREVEEIDASDLPESGGVYVLYDSGGNVLYIGKAKRFRTEVQQTLKRVAQGGKHLGPKLQKSWPRIGDLASYFSLYEIDNERLRHNIEALLIRVFINQMHNNNLGKFK